MKIRGSLRKEKEVNRRCRKHDISTQRHGTNDRTCRTKKQPPVGTDVTHEAMGLGCRSAQRDGNPSNVNTG